MFNKENWVVKKTKPFLKRYGFHHVGVAALVFLAALITTPYFAIAGLITYWYYSKEVRENGVGFEIFDFANPAVFSFLCALLELFI